MKREIEITKEQEKIARNLNEYFSKHLDDCNSVEQRESYMGAAILLSYLYDYVEE